MGGIVVAVALMTEADERILVEVLLGRLGYGRDKVEQGVVVMVKKEKRSDNTRVSTLIDQNLCWNVLVVDSDLVNGKEGDD